MGPSWEQLLLLLVTVIQVRGDREEPYVVYENGATSERTLPVCSSPREACSVVRKRFWLSPIVKRLCKCPDMSDCPDEWNLEDGKSVAINARAQLKFCGYVHGHLPQCKEKDVAAVHMQSNNVSGYTINTIQANCFCPTSHYFQARSTSNEKGDRKLKYSCTPLGRCRQGDFCGHITHATYETYHRCSCPRKHICVMQTRDLVPATEFLYKGLAYTGVCTFYD